MLEENGKNESAEVLDRVQAWHKQGAELHAKLLDERSHLLARLKEIDAALMLLPGATPSLEPRATEPTVTAPVMEAAPVGDAPASELPLPMSALRKLSMPQLVKMVVHSKPAGINAAGVIEIALRVNPKADPSLVHSGLYRNLDGGEIRSEGSRGTRVYYPVIKTEGPM
jgi:hypothetical protein